MVNGIKVDLDKFKPLSVGDQRSAQFEAIVAIDDKVDEFIDGVKENKRDITGLTWGFGIIITSIAGVCFFIIRSGILR